MKKNVVVRNASEYSLVSELVGGWGGGRRETWPIQNDILCVPFVSDAGLLDPTSIYLKKKKKINTLCVMFYIIKKFKIIKSGYLPSNENKILKVAVCYWFL